MDGSGPDHNVSLLREVVYDFEAQYELTSEWRRAGAVDLGACFPCEVGIGIQINRGAAPGYELRHVRGLEDVSLVIGDRELGRAELL